MEAAKVLLYIDNSNIFINTQKFSASKKRYLSGVQDMCCRIDIGSLVDLACGRRELLHGKLYGSEPPALDTVWRAIRQKKIEVHHSKRSTWNSREKQTDTSLVAAAVRDAIVMKDQAGDDRTVILFTGDKDMLPVVQNAQEFQWSVEIWSYRSALSKDLEKEEKQSKNVRIVYIDNFFEKITFAEYIWGGNIPTERSLVLR